MAIKKRKTRAPKKSTVAGDAPPVGPVSEFRNAGDDAWYSVNLVLHGETLIVKYREFSTDGDEEFYAGDLRSSDEIRAFGQRFRPLSKRLEGSDCSIVEQGMRFCVLRVFSEDDHRFYDAIVEAVKHEEHTIVDGAEKCSCSFVLSWLHGPEAGILTSATIEDLCPIQSRALIDPRLACFLEIAKWKHGITSPCSGWFTEGLTCNQESPLSSKFGSQCVIQKSEKPMQIGSVVLDEEGTFGYERNEDVDLGGGYHTNDTITNRQTNGQLFLVDNMEDMACVGQGGNQCPYTHLTEDKASSQSSKKDVHYSTAMETCMYFVLVENLERNVYPSTIVDFIQEATSLEIEAFVFSSLSTEPYSRGALVVNSIEELEQLCKFVAKPDQMITSSKGRPWIVSDTSAPELVRTSFWCLEPDFQNKREHSDGGGLKAVQLGSEEYSKAEKLRDLFLEFAKHQEQLLKRLALEERNILDN